MCRQSTPLPPVVDPPSQAFGSGVELTSGSDRTGEGDGEGDGAADIGGVGAGVGGETTDALAPGFGAGVSAGRVVAVGRGDCGTAAGSGDGDEEGSSAQPARPRHMIAVSSRVPARMIHPLKATWPR